MLKIKSPVNLFCLSCLFSLLFSSCPDRIAPDYFVLEIENNSSQDLTLKFTFTTLNLAQGESGSVQRDNKDHMQLNHFLICKMNTNILIKAFAHGSIWYESVYMSNDYAKDKLNITDEFLDLIEDHLIL